MYSTCTCISSFSSLASTITIIFSKVCLFQREIHLKPTFGASISYIIVFALSFESKISKMSLVMLLVFDLSFESETHAAGEKKTRFITGKLHDLFCAYKSCKTECKNMDLSSQ